MQQRLSKNLRQDSPPVRDLVSVHFLTQSFLLSTAPQVLNTSSPAQQAENEAKASSSISIDESQPTTNIQIRLADGGRLVQKFNHSHRYLVLSGLSYSRRVSETSTNGWEAGSCSSSWHQQALHAFPKEGSGLGRYANPKPLVLVCTSINVASNCSHPSCESHSSTVKLGDWIPKGFF